MGVFQYEAVDSSGSKQKGTVEAASSEDAIKRIRLQGLHPQSVREQKSKKKKGEVGGDASSKKKKTSAKKKGGGFSIGKVKPKILTAFTRQLSTLQDAGLPLLRSLQILESQQKPGKLKSVLLGVVEDVEGGSSLSESMAKHPKAFNILYTKMVAAGEIGGVLDVILQRLSEFMEKAEALKRKIIGASIYPIAVIAVALLIVTGIMYFIIPKFEEIFADFGVELPTFTVLLTESRRWVAGKTMPVPGAVYIPGWVVMFATRDPFCDQADPQDKARQGRVRRAAAVRAGGRKPRPEDDHRAVHPDARHADRGGCADP